MFDAARSFPFIDEHDAATVQPQKLGKQMQDLLENQFGAEVFASNGHHLLKQQHLLGAPISRSLATARFTFHIVCHQSLPFEQ
ncbi:hypothetical protein D3C86_1921670 [compost metagenome]